MELEGLVEVISPTFHPIKNPFYNPGRWTAGKVVWKLKGQEDLNLTGKPILFSVSLIIFKSSSLLKADFFLPVISNAWP